MIHPSWSSTLIATKRARPMLFFTVFVRQLFTPITSRVQHIRASWTV